MTLWTDNRNHLLDDVMTALVLTVVAKLIGVGPGQFVALVALSQLSENFQHANFRCSFGWLGIVCWSVPGFIACTTPLGLATSLEAERPWADTTLGSCFHGGTCSSKPQIYQIATTQQGFAIKSKKGVITDRAFGRNKNWACSVSWPRTAYLETHDRFFLAGLGLLPSPQGGFAFSVAAHFDGGHCDGPRGFIGTLLLALCARGWSSAQCWAGVRPG
jgi:hypothetical protein